MVGQVVYQENFTLPLHLEELNEFFTEIPKVEHCSICQVELDDNYTSIALGGMVCYSCISQDFWATMNIRELYQVVFFRDDIKPLIHKYNFVICINESQAMYVSQHTNRNTCIILKNDPMSPFGDIWKYLHVERRSLYLVDAASFRNCNFNTSIFYICKAVEQQLESLSFYFCVMPHSIRYEKNSIECTNPIRPSEWSNYNGR